MTTTTSPQSDLAAALNMPTAPAELPAASVRLKSLDVFRGLTIAGMILVNNIDEDVAYKSLTHSNWHGWTPTDLVFPFFMFIMGVAIPFSLAKRRTVGGQSRGELLAHIWVRALALILIGWLLHAALAQGFAKLPAGYATVKFFRYFITIFSYGGMIALLIPWRNKFLSNWLAPILAVIFIALMFTMHIVSHNALAAGLHPKQLGGGLFTPEDFRIPGVLQRIGLCYGIAATAALFFGPRMLIVLSIIFLALYASLMYLVPFPGHVTGSISKADNLEHSIDVAVFNRGGQNHLYGEYADPEGLLSTIPAAVTPMLGILLGIWLRRKDRNVVEKCAAMLAMGVFLAIVGVFLDSILMPINKKIWTPSFVVFTAGMAMLGLGAIFWLIDVRGKGGWTWPFKVLGMNAIAAYVGGDVIDHIGHLITIHPPRYREGISLSGFVEDYAKSHAAIFSNWLHHVSPRLPILATPANLTMLYPIILILAVLLVMWILYAFKIFVKV